MAPVRFWIGAQTDVGEDPDVAATFIPFGSGAYVMSRS